MNTPLVYVLRCDGFFKIGFTRTSIQDRVRIFQSGNPHNIEIYSSYMTPMAYHLEKYLHSKYLSKLKRGEWFSLCNEDLENMPIFVANFNNLMSIETKETK